jgi:hypothetical protein
LRDFLAAVITNVFHAPEQNVITERCGEDKTPTATTMKNILSDRLKSLYIPFLLCVHTGLLSLFGA